MERKKATGSRGSWFADVDGEALPCVHKYWWPSGATYNDTGLADSAKARELVEAIRRLKRVVLTTDEPRHDGGKLTFTRTGYVAVYEVDDVEFDEAGLRFRFVKRLVSLN